ncbi:MAG: hypothetical protein WBO34_03285 [Gammaproteobacteria bacterium]
MPRTTICALYPLIALLTALPAWGADVPQALGTDEPAAAFAAAGFRQSPDKTWIRCEEDPPTLSYVPGRAKVTDLNGDRHPEVWITENSTFCYGNTGSAFVLLTGDGDGWRTLLDKTGMRRLFDTQSDG